MLSISGLRTSVKTFLKHFEQKRSFCNPYRPTTPIDPINIHLQYNILDNQSPLSVKIAAGFHASRSQTTVLKLLEVLRYNFFGFRSWHRNLIERKCQKVELHLFILDFQSCYCPKTSDWICSTRVSIDNHDL